MVLTMEKRAWPKKGADGGSGQAVGMSLSLLLGSSAKVHYYHPTMVSSTLRSL